MRQSYRDKRSRQARINKEKEENLKNKKTFNKKSAGDRRTKIVDDRNLTRRNENKVRNFEEKVDVSIDKEYEDIVAGRNAVLELLKSNKDINKIFVERGEKHGSINEIIAKAREDKIVLVEVDKSKLDGMTNENHQVLLQ